MNENIQLSLIDHEISQINPESRIDPRSRVNPGKWFNPEIRINLDSQIKIRFKSSLRLSQLPRLHWHYQRKNTPTTRPAKVHQQNIKMTQPDQDVSRVKFWESNQSSELNQSRRAIQSNSRINLESRINCLIRINSPIWPTFKIPSKRSAGQRILRQRYNFYLAYSFYVDTNL